VQTTPRALSTVVRLVVGRAGTLGGPLGTSCAPRAQRATLFVRCLATKAPREPEPGMHTAPKVAAPVSASLPLGTGVAHGRSRPGHTVTQSTAGSHVHVHVPAVVLKAAPATPTGDPATEKKEEEVPKGLVARGKALFKKYGWVSCVLFVGLSVCAPVPHPLLAPLGASWPVVGRRADSGAGSPLPRPAPGLLRWPCTRAST
jgi:hypothetical protein